MAINFPNSPSNGDTHVVGSKTFVYNSTTTSWSVQGSASVDITSITGDILPDTDSSRSLGSASKKWKDLFLSGDTISLGSIKLKDAGGSLKVETGAGADVSPGGIKVYANLAAFPSSGNTAGDMGFATDTKAVYVWDGTEWDRISSGSNEVPEITTEPAAGINLATDGSTTSTITMAATDPEGFPITYSHDTNPTSQAQATSITESGGVFTLTPSGTQSNAGSFTLRTKASDGVHVTTRSSTIKLGWGISNVYGIQFYETSRYYNAYVHHVMLVGPTGNWYDDSTFLSEATYSTHQWTQGIVSNSNVTAFYRKYFNAQLPATFNHNIADTSAWNCQTAGQSGSGNMWCKWTTPRILSGVLNSGYDPNDYGYMREGYYRLYIGGTTAGDLAATQYTLTLGSASDTGNTGSNGVPIAQINRLYDHTAD